jgi:hypothetical protein
MLNQFDLVFASQAAALHRVKFAFEVVAGTHGVLTLHIPAATTTAVGHHVIDRVSPGVPPWNPYSF